MTKKIIFNTIAIISTIGIFCWLMTDFFGGMMIYLISYWIIIIPIVILYVISVFDTVIATIRRGIKANKIKVIFHGLLLVCIVALNLFQADTFKSKRILTATLKDDLFHYTLVFRENGDCETQVSGMFGFEEVHYGRYKLFGDTIVFEKIPYDNDFLPDTLLINRSEKAIFIKKDKTGKFSEKIEWLNHFEIH